VYTVIRFNGKPMQSRDSERARERERVPGRVGEGRREGGRKGESG
jgi:hypothetical protein